MDISTEHMTNTASGRSVSRRDAVIRASAGGLGLVLALRAATAAAQESTPEDTGLPEGVLVTFPPQITPFALPEEPGAVQIIWLVMEPNTAVPTHPHPYSEFAFMLAGTARFLTEEGPPAQVIRTDHAGTAATPEAGPPGTELTANEGDVAIFPSGNVSDTRAGDEGATILVLEIVTAADGMATPAG